MASVFHSCLLLALLAGFGLQAEAATPVQDQDPKTSPIFASRFIQAQDALSKKQWSEVIVHAQAVLATGSRKPDDTYAAYYFLAEANRGLGNLPEMRAAFRGMLDSGFPVPQAMRVRIEQGMQ